MSVLTGTATDYLDLLVQLRTFLKTDATLVGLGQNWTEVATNATPYSYLDNGVTNTVDFETYLKAPGLSTTEAIYVNIQAYHNAGNDIWNWRLKGAIGFIALGGGSTFETQPGSSPDAFILLWNQPITFWFIANGQRVIVVAKIATVYESCYLGKLLPYGTPGQYPYPLVIAGTTGIGSPTMPFNLPGNANMRYSDTSNAHAAFFDPDILYWCDLNSGWRGLTHWSSFGGHVNSGGADAVWPWFAGDGYPADFMEPNLDGSYPLFAARLEIATLATPEVLGELDGVFYTTGFGSSSESTFTVGGDTYYVFQSCFRTSKEFFAALKWA